MPMSFGGVSKQKVATVIVAADGTGDTTDIQTGINLLPAAGGVVYIKEGIYTITATIEITSDNISIRGSGYSTQIKTTSDIKMLYVHGAPIRKITLDSLRFVGAGVGNTSNIGIHFEFVTPLSCFNLFIESCGAEGIYISDTSSDIHVQTTTILQCIGSALKINGCLAVDISSSSFAYNTKHGIECENLAREVYITSCYVYLNTEDNIYFNGGNNNKVIGSYIKNSGKHGIKIASNQDTEIIGNRIDYNDDDETGSYDGVFLDNSDRILIANNHGKRNDRYNINISNNTCNDCIVTGNTLQSTGTLGNVNDAGTNTLPNGATGTTNLALDDLNIMIV